MKITFHWVGGATFILQIDTLKIAVDPVLCQKGTIQNYFWFTSKRLEDPVYQENDFQEIDLWLITHNHEDHLDTIGLSNIAPSAHIVSNGNSVDKLQQINPKHLTVLPWNKVKSYQLKGFTISVESIPAIHGINPISALFAGKVNGYYITVSREDFSFTTYITGDTVFKQKVIKAMQNKPIDLLVPNMGAAKQGSWIMTLTLNAKMLQKFIFELQPNLIIPVHYGTFEHYKEPVSAIVNLSNNRIQLVRLGSKTRIKIN